MNVRICALQHPDEVVGMVLIDARSEYVDEHSSPAEVQSFRQSIATQGTLYRLARRLGLVRLFDSGQRGQDATSTEALERATDDAQLKAAGLGELPLIVLAAGQSMEHLPNWPEAQRRQAALSTKGRLIVVEGSGHAIQMEQPAPVI